MSARRGGGSTSAAGSSGQQGQVSAVHRYAFIQALMARGYLSEDDAKSLVKRLVPDPRGEAFNTILEQANKDLIPLNFKIRGILNPVDHVKYIGFVNTHVDDSSKSGSRLKHEQREFFKAALERIAMDYHATHGHCSASEIDLLNLDLRSSSTQATQDPGPSTQLTPGGNRVVKLSKADRLKTLKELVGEGWLAPDPHHAGHYCVGVRSFLELSEYLLSLDISEETRAAWHEIL